MEERVEDMNNREQRDFSGISKGRTRFLPKGAVLAGLALFLLMGLGGEAAVAWSDGQYALPLPSYRGESGSCRPSPEQKMVRMNDPCQDVCSSEAGVDEYGDAVRDRIRRKHDRKFQMHEKYQLNCEDYWWASSHIECRAADSFFDDVNRIVENYKDFCRDIMEGDCRDFMECQQNANPASAQGLAAALGGGPQSFCTEMEDIVRSFCHQADDEGSLQGAYNRLIGENPCFAKIMPEFSTMKKICILPSVDPIFGAL